MDWNLVPLLKSEKKLKQEVNFISNFGRDIEYYTGIIFEVFAGKKETAKGLFSERSRTLTDTSMPEHTGPLRRVEPDWICAGSLMSGRVDV